MTTQTVREGEVALRCREIDRDRWLPVLTRFLKEERGQPWTSFIAQQYLLGNSGHLVPCWYLAFRSGAISHSVERIGALLLRATLPAHKEARGTGILDFTPTAPPSQKSNTGGPDQDLNLGPASASLSGLQRKPGSKQRGVSPLRGSGT